MSKSCSPMRAASILEAIEALRLVKDLPIGQVPESVWAQCMRAHNSLSREAAGAGLHDLSVPVMLPQKEAA